jgi:hydroxymethylglutaryl-CoA synthase
MTISSGIDSIGVAIPSTYVELAELARHRGIAPEKFTEGLGTVRMAVPRADEDTVTLAARAARLALANAEISASEIGLCIVGTETAVDHSKPVASFVQGLLGLPKSCRIYETKHACYGGTAGLHTALDWIRSGSARGRKALIICADIARYGLNTPGEPTQGAGAVALVVSEAPRVLVIDPEVGTYSDDVFDFWRPLSSKDAVVDGHYSTQCYLASLEGAYLAYRERVGDAGPGFSDRFSAIAYHVPYGKLARKAHRVLRALDGDTDPDKSFTQQVQPSLVIPSQVGNIYTGSLYLALASHIAMAPAAAGRMGLYSYGSGSCAEFFSGVLQPNARKHVGCDALLQALEQRQYLSIAEYETIMNERETMDDREAVAGGEVVSGMRYLGTHEQKRVYVGGVSRA